MKLLLVALVALTLSACEKHKAKDQYVQTFSDAPVHINSVPNDVTPDKYGHVSFIWRVQHLTQEPTAVYIKKHDDQEWVKLPTADEGYLYDPIVKEIRFRDCNQYWAYALYY